jgi:hypothetical protein
VNPYTIVIPSKLYENQLLCIDAIRASGCKAPIIVVQDGGQVYNSFRPVSRFDPLSWIPGVVPFIFARNVNIGIEAAGDDDVFVLNDDAIWQRGSIDELAAAAQERRDLGVVTPAIVGLTNDFQRPQSGKRLRTVDHAVPFVGAYFRRTVISGFDPTVLDERFIAYGYEDDDCCRRLRDRGYRIGIFDDCVFEHGSVASTFRGKAPAGPEMLAQNLAIYEEKWRPNQYSIWVDELKEIEG